MGRFLSKSRSFLSDSRIAEMFPPYRSHLPYELANNVSPVTRKSGVIIHTDPFVCPGVSIISSSEFPRASLSLSRNNLSAGAKARSFPKNVLKAFFFSFLINLLSYSCMYAGIFVAFLKVSKDIMWSKCPWVIIIKSS